MQNKLFDTLIKLENRRITYIISGDININLNLKSDNIRNYVDFMSSIGCKSMIRNPIRFSDNGKASLLDHIYTNPTKLKIKAGVCLYDISNHLPTFFILKNTNFSAERVTKLKRCMRNFIFELNSQLSRIDFNSAHKNVNSHAHELTTLFKAVLDKHAPLRVMSRNEKRPSKKPWITRGLLKSIRTKNKLFNTCYKRDDVAKKQKYKKYLNKLTHL